MAIYMICGSPGQGKNQKLARIGLRWMKKRRPVFSDFALDGAKPLIALEDVISPAFRGAVVLVDEVGVAFSARDTMDFDRLVFAACTQHRKNGVDIYMASQAPAYVDVSIRRIIEQYCFMRRYGPDGRAALEGTEPPFFRRPWAFRESWYLPDDFTSEMEVRENANPRYRSYFPFSKGVARRFNTFQRVIGPDLQDRVALLYATAETRANLPPYRVRNGLWEQVELPQGYSVSIPARVSPRSTRSGLPPASNALDAQATSIQLRMRGIYQAGELDADGAPMVDLLGRPLINTSVP